jgi:hypothetical protein
MGIHWVMVKRPMCFDRPGEGTPMLDHFSKLLVARHSPKNKCYAPDDAVLFVRSAPSVDLRKDTHHYFTGAGYRSTRSRYGWVKDVAPFVFDDFVRQHLNEIELSEDDRAHLKTMLQSIAKLPAGTPVAASYSVRGVEVKRPIFVVHQVVFHKA